MNSFNEIAKKSELCVALCCECPGVGGSIPRVLKSSGRTGLKCTDQGRGMEERWSSEGGWGEGGFWGRRQDPFGTAVHEPFSSNSTTMDLREILRTFGITASLTFALSRAGVRARAVSRSLGAGAYGGD